MKYMGATSWFIKYPFVVEGILMGLASAIISWIVVSLTYSGAYIYLPKVGAELGVFGFIGYSSMWHIILIAFLTLGIFLGGIGSSFATRRYLKEFRPIKITLNKKARSGKQDENSKEKEKRDKKREKEEIKLKKENLKREAKEKQEQEKKSKQEFERKRKARRLSVILLVLVMSSPFTKILYAESTQDKIDHIDKETSAAAKKYEQVQADIKVFEKDVKELEDYYL